MSSMMYKDKKRKTDHHVIGMDDSMPQKSRTTKFVIVWIEFSPNAHLRN